MVWQRPPTALIGIERGQITCQTQRQGSPNPDPPYMNGIAPSPGLGQDGAWCESAYIRR